MRRGGDHDKPARQGPTICDDVLSCARAGSGGDSADHACAVVPIAPPVGSHVVKRDGTSTNRTADAANAAQEQTTHSSPGGHKEIFPKPRLGADPRTPPEPSPRRLAPLLAADAPVADIDNSAGGGTRGRFPSSARSAWHANAATDRPPTDMPDYNTAIAATRAQRTVRSLSTDSDVAADPGRSLAPDKIVDQNEVDPRERQLPKGQVLERISTPLRDALYLLPYPSAPSALG